VLLPETDVVGGGRDHHQWTSVLHATSAMRAYHHVYRGDYSPSKIADFLILNGAFPRSVAFCYQQIGTHLGRLARTYGVRHACHTTTTNMISRLDDLDMNDVFADGLHEFIESLLATTNRLHGEINSAYHL
ncbi:MAG TPA: alpha-E domain-containing protein, partial [Thermohalobaculum sp.]|nr:alpha-E domain-containing protein [Thermohalobaculum sp.]